MRKAGFRYVFLGIENVLDEDLAFLRASAKNAQREGGRRVGNATIQAIDALHRAGLSVVGGIIVGNPDDTRASIEANLAFAKRYVDWPYIQHPTPYPGTPMTEDFRRRGLIVNDRVEEYDGTTAVVRTEHLDADDIEFLRWRAERWMKVRHLPGVLRRYPGFVAAQRPADAARTRSAGRRGGRSSGSRASGRCSRATRRAAPPSASTCRRPDTIRADASPPPMLRKQFLETSRGRIAELLQRGARTVDDLASELRLTPNAVRSHLTAMERDGLVRRAGLLPGPTRPSHTYRVDARARRAALGRLRSSADAHGPDVCRRVCAATS